MKLLGITPYFHQKSGGIKRYINEKIKFLSDKEIFYVLIITGNKNRVYSQNSTKIYQAPSIPIPFTGGYRFFTSTQALKNIIEVEKPDIVELDGSYQPIPSLKSNRYKLSVIYHSDIRTDISFLPLPERLKRLIVKTIATNRLSKADIIITPSERQKEFLRGLGLTRLKTVNLGVDKEIFRPLPKDVRLLKRLGLKGDRITLLYVGRLSPEKNIDTLLDIFQRLDHRLYQLLIVGDGPLKRKVLKTAEKNPSLVYLGYIESKQELSKIYGSAEIFITTSTNETYGLSFLEAQACGCILVGYDMGLETQPFKEFLAKDKSIESFVEAIQRAQSSLNVTLKEKISNFIRQKFSWEVTFKEILKIYKEML